MKLIRFVLPLIIVSLLVIGCAKATESNLQKIHAGMTTDEVKSILGDPTSAETGNAMGVFSGTTYIYHTENSDVKITFLNDKVVATEGSFQ